MKGIDFLRDTFDAMYIQFYMKRKLLYSMFDVSSSPHLLIQFFHFLNFDIGLLYY